MIDKIKDTIKLYGYELQAGDKGIIEYLINSESERLKNEINDSIIPEGLEYFLIKRVVGAFYDIKLSSNNLGDGFDFSEAVKQIVEGDTSVTFKEGISNEEKFRACIESLRGGSDFLCYRRLKW